MEYNNELCRNLIRAIVDTYKENYEKCSKSSTRVSCIGIDFKELFSSEKLDIQIGERYNDFVFRVQGQQINSHSKILRKRVIKALNISELVFSDLLLIINLLQKFENENLIVFSNRLKSNVFPNFDNDNGNNISYLNINNHKIEEYIKENYYSQIIPTTTLIDIAENDFKTVEQRRFDEQNCSTWIGIVTAIVIGIMSPILSKCISEKGEQEKIEQIVNAINKQKTVTIDSVKVFPKDTFNVKVIHPKVKTMPKSQHSQLKQ